MGWSTKKKRGRPKVSRTPHDYGNERVQARVALFRNLKGDSSIGFEMTCAGRLMLVGAFDGLEYEPEIYLAALLTYQNGYWRNYGGGPAVAQYERRDREHNSVWEDPDGEWFKFIDKKLTSAGRQARNAVHAVTVDRHWFPDEDIAWAGRIIESRLWKDASLAYDSDYAMLDLLRSGAMALVGQGMRRAA